MKHHIISRDGLIAYMEEERWERYASSATVSGSKSLDFSNRRQFKVTIDGVTAYSGQSITDAVDIYND